MKKTVGTVLMSLFAAQNVFAGDIFNPTYGPRPALTAEADCSGIATLVDETPGSNTPDRDANILVKMRDENIYVTMNEPTINDIQFEFVRTKPMEISLSNPEDLIGYGTFAYAHQKARLDVVLKSAAGTKLNIKALDLRCTNTVRR